MFKTVIMIEETEKLRNPPLLNFLKLYFDYAYFFCLSPFRFVKDKDSGNNIIQERLLQKILCAIAHIISILILLRDLQSKILQPPASYFRNPVKYFQLIDSIFNFAYKFTLIKRLWWNRQQFLILAKFIQTKKYFHLINTRAQKPICIHSVLLFYTVIAVASLIAGKNFVSGLSDWNPEWWIRRLVAYTRFTFFIDPEINFKKGAPALSDITTWEILLSSVMVFGLLTRFLLGFFIDMCILMTTATLWSVSTSFSSSIRFDPYEKWLEKNTSTSAFLATLAQAGVLKKSYQIDHKERSKPLPWSKIYESFHTIRVLAHLINNALGSLVMWFILEALMYYSVNMDAFLINKDYFRRAYLLAYYLGTVAMFVLSSDICKKLEATKAWLAEDANRFMIPSEDLQLVLHEMLSKDIGIRGWGVFTITFPAFASFVGTIITFFIICVEQSKS